MRSPRSQGSRQICVGVDRGASSCAVVGASLSSRSCRPWRAPRRSPQALPGWPLYDRYCLACHGDARRWPRPRRAVHVGPAARRSRAASTSGARRRSGSRRPTTICAPTIRFGAPGTSMPAFDDVLSPARDRRAHRDRQGVRARARCDGGRSRSRSAPPPPPDPARGAELWTQARLRRRATAPAATATGRARALRAPPYDLTTRAAAPAARADDRDARRARRRAEHRDRHDRHADAGLRRHAPRRRSVGARRSRRRARRARDAPRRAARSTPTTIAADRAAPIATGDLARHRRPDEAARVRRAPIAPQGPPPRVARARARRRCRARQCARCHAKQFREWQRSLHARRGIARAARADRCTACARRARRAGAATRRSPSRPADPTRCAPRA